MKNQAIILALKQALESDRLNGDLWLHLANLQREDGLVEDAMSSVRIAAEMATTKLSGRKMLVTMLREAGHLDEALLRAEALQGELESAGEDAAEIRAELALIQQARGQTEEATELSSALPTELSSALPTELGSGPAEDPETRQLNPAAVEDDNPEQALADWASQFDWSDLKLGLDDVVGLEDVKRQINLRILAPFKQPEIYEAFGRSGGGGILMYGPPGCGKTYIARATAGELGARFVSVSIHDVLDKYYGQSEKHIHALFEDARRNSPTVLFFDEFDALGSSRGTGSGSNFWKTLVDQLLQEMDGVGGQNKDVLIFAATNMPWNVDMAFRRPGRFDRVLFVPPPNAEGRDKLLQKHLADLPGSEAIKTAAVAKSTEHYTGADIESLCQRAAENALDKSLDTGQVHHVTQADFDAALKQSRPSSIEWFSTAKNYGRYGNEGGQYDDLVAYLKTIKKW
ncbi:MAG: transitional endoplasmic reticulum ATPase [Bacteroidia bacterium]|jgi:transitional endoplasmic reticulum ATPase